MFFCCCEWVLNFVKCFFCNQLIESCVFSSVACWYDVLHSFEIWMSNQPCMLGISPTWSWSIIIFIYYITVLNMLVFCWGSFPLISWVTVICSFLSLYIFFSIVIVWFWCLGDSGLLTCVNRWCIIHKTVCCIELVLFVLLMFGSILQWTI